MVSCGCSTTNVGAKRPAPINPIKKQESLRPLRPYNRTPGESPGPSRDPFQPSSKIFNSVTTIRINHLRQTPGCPVWQRNYHDHIIRNAADLARVRAYINDNPLHWDEDSENPAAGR